MTKMQRQTKMHPHRTQLLRTRIPALQITAVQQQIQQQIQQKTTTNLGKGAAAIGRTFNIV